MNRPIQLAIVLIIFALLQPTFVFGQDKSNKKPWTGKLADGTEITEKDLLHLIRQHKIWLESKGESGQRANLEKADLKGAFLSYADLSNAILSGINLSDADLRFSNLNGAILEESNLSNANLRMAQLEKATIVNSNISEANLSYANLF